MQRNSVFIVTKQVHNAVDNRLSGHYDMIPDELVTSVIVCKGNLLSIHLSTPSASALQKQTTSMLSFSLDSAPQTIHILPTLVSPSIKRVESSFFYEWRQIHLRIAVWQRWALLGILLIMWAMRRWTFETFYTTQSPKQVQKHITHLGYGWGSF
jgi:hypothetical protein